LMSSLVFKHDHPATLTTAKNFTVAPLKYSIRHC